MRRAWTASLLTICSGLVVATAYLLTTPPTASAATGTADCGGGITATCSGEICSCTDNVGCTSVDRNGTTTKVTCTDLIRDFNALPIGSLQN